MKLKKGWMIAPLLLAACGSSSEEEQEQIDYSTFDDAAVMAIFDEGDYAKVLEIVRGQEDLSIDDKADHLIAARVHTIFLNGIAAEVAIEKAVEAGAEPTEVALLLARALLLQGKYQQAEKVLEDTVLLEQDAYEALLLRGDINKEVGKNSNARGFYEAAIKDQPDAFRGYVGLALLELYEGNLQSAAELSAAAEERAPDDPIVLYVRGVTLRYQQQLEEAKTYLVRAVEMHPAHVMAHLELVGIHVEERNVPEAEKNLDAVFAVSPEHSMALYYSALILAANGEAEKAEEILLRIGDLTRNFPPAARVYGHVAYRLGKYSTAQPYLKRFLEIIPGDRATRLALAESLTRRGRAREALQYLQPLIGEDSTDLEAFLQASAASGLLGEVTIARGFLSKAETLASGREVDQELVRSLSRRHALARFMTGEREQALAQLRAMYDKDREDFVSLTLLVNMQMETGDLGGAEATSKELIELAPGNPLGMNMLGSIRHRQKRPEDAIELYDSALQINAGYVSALKNRALSYLVMDKFAEAATDLELVVSKIPNDAHAQGMLGRAYLQMGRAKEAVPFLQRAEKAFPTSAIIATDYSQALAALNYTSSAISKARVAKELAGNNEGLVKFLDDHIATWESAIAEQKRQREEEEAERRRKAKEEAERRAKEEAERKAAEEAEKAKQEAEEGAEAEPVDDTGEAEPVPDEEEPDEDEPDPTAWSLAG